MKSKKPELTEDQKRELKCLNTDLQNARKTFESAGIKLDEIATSAGDFLLDLAASAHEYFDSKSGSWQESDEGIAYESWLMELEDIASDLQSIQSDLSDDGAINSFQDMYFAMTGK